MYCFFDSSFLLSILMHDKNYIESKEMWENSHARFGSILLKVECITVLRRFFTHNQSKLSNNWLITKELEFENLINEVHIRILDNEIYNTIKLKPALSKCRSLDAIHIATALEFVIIKNDAQDFFLCTYDKNMHTLADDLGMSVYPKLLNSK